MGKRLAAVKQRALTRPGETSALPGPRTLAGTARTGAAGAPGLVHAGSSKAARSQVDPAVGPNLKCIRPVGAAAILPSHALRAARVTAAQNKKGRSLSERCAGLKLRFRRPPLLGGEETQLPVSSKVGEAAARNPSRYQTTRQR